MNTTTLPATPALYQPTVAEIVHVTESAKHRRPLFASRIDKARDILLDGSLQIEPAAWHRSNVVNWRIASQSHAGAYILVGLGCPCQDSRAQKLGNVRFCKHSIAVASYLKILRNRFNADVRNRDIDLGVLGNGEFHAYGKYMGYVQVAKLGREGETYTFINHAGAAHYAIWLAKREGVRQAVTMPALSALAA